MYTTLDLTQVVDSIKAKGGYMDKGEIQIKMYAINFRKSLEPIRRLKL